MDAVSDLKFDKSVFCPNAVFFGRHLYLMGIFRGVSTALTGNLVKILGRLDKHKQPACCVTDLKGPGDHGCLAPSL